MSSLMTNTAAMTALSTLQMTNKSLDETQNRISTGYRVAEASDNAAYWSIATTMRSDNKSMSAVKDSLGIGAATVDTAYTGMTAVKDVLDEIKAKLTTATGENVDKTKVQGEISQLQEQLKSIAGSASFSGQNFLSVNGNSTSSIVSSFSRNAAGGITLGSIQLDTAKTALFNSDANVSGLLEGSSATATQSTDFTGLAATADGGTLTFSIKKDGAATATDYTINIGSTAANFGVDDMVNRLNEAFGSSGLVASADAWQQAGADLDDAGRRLQGRTERGCGASERHNHQHRELGRTCGHVGSYGCG